MSYTVKEIFYTPSQLFRSGRSEGFTPENP